MAVSSRKSLTHEGLVKQNRTTTDSESNLAIPLSTYDWQSNGLEAQADPMLGPAGFDSRSGRSLLKTILVQSSDFLEPEMTW